MKVLITGAAGFIGGHLSKHLEEHGYDVTRMDCPWRTLQTIPEIGDIHRFGDLAAPTVMPRAMEMYEPDLVIHLAAQIGRVLGDDVPSLTVQSNAVATINVAVACRNAGIPLIYTSTSEVYGDLQGMEAVESMVLNQPPHNLYGLTKLWGEEAIALVGGSFQIVRLSMPYGPGLPAGRGRAAIVNFIDQARRRVEIPVHRGAERSWCWVGDTVAGIRTVLEDGDQGANAEDWSNGVGIYNVGRDDDPRPMGDVAAMACDIVGAPRDLITIVDPPTNVTPVKRLSTRKLRRLGWEPKVGLEEGMQMLHDAMYATKAA